MVGIELLDGEVFVLDLSGLLLQKLCNRVVDRNTWVKAPKRTFLARRTDEGFSTSRQYLTRELMPSCGARSKAFTVKMTFSAEGSRQEKAESQTLVTPGSACEP